MNTIPPSSVPDFLFFIEELEAYNYRWQTDFHSMLTAARAAGLEGMYWRWLSGTPEGRARQATLAGVMDIREEEARAREQQEAITADFALEDYPSLWYDQEGAEIVPDGCAEDSEEAPPIS
jgi:hypothetical protein